MNSKQRVMMALEHKEPDRVPIAFNATPEVNKKLMEHFSFKSEEDLLRRFRVDFRYITPRLKIPTCGDFFGDPLIKDLGNYRYQDVWGTTFKRIDYGIGTYIEYEDSPIAGYSSPSDLQDYPWPNVHDIWDFSNIKKDANKFGDFAIVYDGAVLFQFCQALRGLKQLLIDLSTNIEFARALLERVVTYWIDFGTALLSEADGTVDFFVINDDYGMQQGPMFNPEVWRSSIKPLISKVVKVYKQFGTKIIFHSCGSITQFIPDLIEMGIDVLDPIQVGAKDMDPRYLKAAYGDRLSFRGAIDTQSVLPYGTPEEVNAEVKKRINQLAKGGGYIATSVHNIQPDVPIPNILALFDAIWEHGQYPLLNV